jgi:predicted outer membrane repeat protein
VSFSGEVCANNGAAISADTAMKSHQSARNRPEKDLPIDLEPMPYPLM